MGKQGTLWKTGDVVELLEIPGGAILKCLGNGRTGSIPRRVTGCAANQGRSAGLDGASAARFPSAKAQKSKQSDFGNSIASPYLPPVSVLQFLQVRHRA